MNKLSTKIVHLLLAFALCSCSGGPGVTYPLTGAVAGTALGAGTGALIGSAIANGDVAASALLGGSIGLVGGAAIGAAYKSIREAAIVGSNDSQIRENYEHLVQTERELERYREELRIDASSMDVVPESTEYIYTGPTLGAYNR